MKNLIVFSDGTSNTKSTNTNVHQFYQALRKDPKNLCFYDKGVGSFKADIPGMVFGTGLSKNIRDCYEFLVDNFELGDRIFVFGFSRGAYTARSLASFVSSVGIVQEFSKDKRRVRKKRLPSLQQIAIRRSYDVYKKNKTASFSKSLKKHKKDYEILTAQIHGIGVWDTVGALGLPDLKKSEAAYDEHRYHNMLIPKNCKYAYQALAIDEERRTFEPILLKKRPSSAVKIDEVWFPGMHSDVGGGYKENKQLSNISLKWMAEKFKLTLNIDTSEFGDAEPLGKMHDSDKKIYSSRKRNIPKNSRIHKTVVTRIGGPLTTPNKTREPTGDYRPHALKGVNFSKPPKWNLGENYKLV